MLKKLGLWLTVSFLNFNHVIFDAKSDKKINLWHAVLGASAMFLRTIKRVSFPLYTTV